MEYKARTAKGTAMTATIIVSFSGGLVGGWMLRRAYTRYALRAARRLRRMALGGKR